VLDAFLNPQTMTIVIPFHSKNSEQTELLLKLIAKAKRNRKCILLIDSQIQHEKDKFVDLASIAFTEVFVRVVEVGEAKWPQAANRNFQSAIRAVNEVAPTEPFYFMEPDCVPMVHDWDDRLFTEYNISQKPYMGVENKTLFLNRAGEVVPDSFPHLVGAAVYRGNYLKCGLNFCWKNVPANIPFDVHLRFEMKAQGWHNTKLIQHNYRTTNYRKEGEKIICDGPDTYSDASPIKSETVIVHGVKDNSLLNLRLELAPVVKVVIPPKSVVKKNLTSGDDMPLPGSIPLGESDGLTKEEVARAKGKPVAQVPEEDVEGFEVGVTSEPFADEGKVAPAPVQEPPASNTFVDAKVVCVASSIVSKAKVAPTKKEAPTPEQEGSVAVLDEPKVDKFAPKEIKMTLEKAKEIVKDVEAGMAYKLILRMHKTTPRHVTYAKALVQKAKDARKK
jgi:hypothetical protein